MDVFAEEIWRDRLSSLIDTSKVKDKQSLLTEIKKLSNPDKHGQGNPQAKQQLIKHISSLLANSTSLEKTITANIFSTTNLRELKKLSRRKPRIVRKAAIRRMTQILKFQQKVQEKRTLTTSASADSKYYKIKSYSISPQTKYTKSQTTWIRERTNERSNKLLAIQFYKKYHKYLSPDAIKAKKLRLKGTKHT